MPPKSHHRNDNLLLYNGLCIIFREGGQILHEDRLSKSRIALHNDRPADR